MLLSNITYFHKSIDDTQSENRIWAEYLQLKGKIPLDIYIKKKLQETSIHYLV